MTGEIIDYGCGEEKKEGHCSQGGSRLEADRALSARSRQQLAHENPAIEGVHFRVHPWGHLVPIKQGGDDA